MRRFPSQSPTVKRRPAESDTTVLMMAAIVLVLLLIVGGLGGLAVWQWRLANEARLAAEQATYAQAMRAEVARQEAEEMQQQARRTLEQLRQAEQDRSVRPSVQAGSWVAAPALSPWHLLPLLPEGSTP